MANKKQTKKVHRKENRIEREAEKMQRLKTRTGDDDWGKLAASVEKRNEREDFGLAAGRIVIEAPEKG